MAPPIGDEVNTHSKDETKSSKTQEQPPLEGSLRSLARKSSDFSHGSQCLHSLKDSYEKYRRYVELKVSDIFNALIGLYTQAFEAQWQHFKRTSESISPHGTDITVASRAMATIYVTHWVLDLYASVRACVHKLTPVAFNQAFSHKIAFISNEYDAFLVALNASIRPTHLVGIHEDVMFIPRFPENSDFTDENPFHIQGFAPNKAKFKLIMNAIKDKRAGWKIETLSTDTVGRPFWLFDWFNSDLACTWFPQEGNFNSTDIGLAYTLGVACTPKLAHFDEDVWQPIPAVPAPGFPLPNIPPRRSPRVTFGDYEVEHYRTGTEKFKVFIDDLNVQGDAPRRNKRHRGGRDESDPSTPKVVFSATNADLDSEEIELAYVCRMTYLYYARVIFKSDDTERLNGFLTIIQDPTQHCTQ